MHKEKYKRGSENADSLASPISSVHSSPLLGAKKKHNRHSSTTNTANISSKGNSLYKIFPLRVQIKFRGIYLFIYFLFYFIYLFFSY